LLLNWGVLILHSLIYFLLTYWLQKRKDILWSKLWIMNYELWIMNYELWIMNYELWFFRTYTVENSSSSLSAKQCSKVDKYQSNKNSKP
jgi:hypothetical protein